MVRRGWRWLVLLTTVRILVWSASPWFLLHPSFRLIIWPEEAVETRNRVCCQCNCPNRFHKMPAKHDCNEIIENIIILNFGHAVCWWTMFHPLYHALLTVLIKRKQLKVFPWLTLPARCNSSLGSDSITYRIAATAPGRQSIQNTTKILFVCKARLCPTTTHGNSI